MKMTSQAEKDITAQLLKRWIGKGDETAAHQLIGLAQRYAPNDKLLCKTGMLVRVYAALEEGKQAVATGNQPPARFREVDGIYREMLLKLLNHAYAVLEDRGVMAQEITFPDLEEDEDEIGKEPNRTDATEIREE